MYIRRNQLSARKFLLIGAALLLLTLPVLVYAQAVSFERMTSATLPWDAVPSPDGDTIYYTAIGDNGCPAVFSIPAGGGDASVVAECQPFVVPMGISMSLDGQTLYVADSWPAGANGNAVYALPIGAPGEISVVAGTQGTAPQGIEVALRNGVETIFYTGVDPVDGFPALYMVDAVGGIPMVLAKGQPLFAPSGVAVSQDGTVVFVLDRLASGNGLGGVIRVQDGHAELIHSNVRTGGQLAGLTLTLDGSLLLVSSLDETAGTAQVLAIDLATQQSSVINDVIGANTAAGGLHRAHNVNQFAWADSTNGVRGGGVYRVRLDI